MSELFPRSTPRKRNSRGFNDREPAPKGDGSLFLWSIFILLLVALVAACWMGTLYIFSHPELPMGYSVLKKFKKLEPPKRFSEIAAPKGEFLDAKKLLARYNNMSPYQLQKESDHLLRGFIRNYQNFDGLVPYITGHYTILDSYELTNNDFFTTGVVALAQDSEVPQVLIENIFTTDEHMVPNLYRTLLTSLPIPIRRSLDLSPVIHVERLPDGRLKLTTVPIQYPNYSAGAGGFSLEPPPTLNVEAGLPILSNAKVLEADSHYASFRHKLAQPDNGASANALPGDTLMPVRTATGPGGQTPPPKVATTNTSVADSDIDKSASAAPPSTPAPQPAATATPEPRVLPAVAVGSTPAPAAGADNTTVGTDVPLKPFMPSSTEAVTSTAHGKWPVYKPGQMPRGKLVGVSDARSLASTDVDAQPLYLRGDFTVTAAVGSSAVLRSSATDPSGAGTSGNTRVVVQYPAGERPPDQGDHVSRAGDRPFLITKIHQTPDGQVNIFVREVTSE